MTLQVIKPDWPAPSQIRAYTTTRVGGVSIGNYASLNLGHDKGDNAVAIAKNEAILQQGLALPETPRWLKQTHSTLVIAAENIIKNTEADASYTTQLNHICAVQTADCLPLLVCDRAGTQVAAIHAGWRGLAAGIIEQTIQQFTMPKDQLLIWLGPAIGAKKFEVGNEVRDLFIAADADAAKAFQTVDSNHWLADIYQLAIQRLQNQQITAIYGGNFCTYTESGRFYSYRRDGECSGRMATLIYIAE